MRPARRGGWSALLGIMFAAALAAGCEDRERAGAPRYRLQVGPAEARVEVAATPEARKVGLSGRRSLGADEGMLFIFPHAGRFSFWMKGTFVPLSVAFVTPDGKIAEIQDMEPETTVAHTPQREALMALEMPAGWFEHKGVKEGDALALPRELAGIEAR
ncbi:MAG: DUF192 domain-containing protein [Planctomycetes bacterium]|nr:DUF192 domain-containing protein [Planctomycetota bacterium]